MLNMNEILAKKKDIQNSTIKLPYSQIRIGKSLNIIINRESNFRNLLKRLCFIFKMSAKEQART